MMQSNELRAGNKLITPEGKIVSVDPLMIMDLWQCEQAKNVGAFRYSPVPLTPELLIKFGFVEIGEIKNEYFKAKYTIRKERRLDNPCYEFYIHSEERKFTKLSSIRYLHQLQNFYFALTGTELSITT